MPSRVSPLFNFDSSQCQTILSQLGTHPLSDAEEVRAKNIIRELGRTKDDIVDQFYLQALKSREKIQQVEKERTLTRFLTDLNEFIELQPHKTGSLIDYLARWFDYQVGPAGNIKYNIDQMQNNIRGLLHTAGRIHSVRRIRELQDYVKQATEGLELSTKDRKLISNMAIEIGSIDRELLAAGNTMAAQAFNRRRYSRYEKILGSLGLSPDEVREISRLGADVSTAFTEVATIARAFGTDIDNMLNTGYITRIFTDMGLLRLKDVSRGDSILDTQTLANMSLTTIFNNARKTNEFAMEDLVAFAEVTGLAQERVFQRGTGILVEQPKRLDQVTVDAGAVPDLVMPRVGGNYVSVKANSPQEALLQAVYELLPSFKTNPQRNNLGETQLLNLLQSLHTQTKSTIDGFYLDIPNATGKGTIKKFVDLSNSLEEFDYRGVVLPLVENPLHMVDYLRERMTAEQVDELLVDTGILTKIPMASTEVFEYFNSKYAFGFQDPSDFINMDIEEAMQGYLNSLNHSAANSGMILGIISGQGVQQGWSVRRGSVEFQLDPKKYSNYVPLGNFSKQLENIGLTPQQIGELNSQLVHPRVAKQLQATIWMNTDPAALSTQGKVLTEIGRLTNKEALLSGGQGYFFRNTLTNMIMAAATGNNLLRVLPAIKKMRRMFAEGLDWLPNEPFAEMSLKKGEPSRWYTYREFAEEFLNRHAANYTPQLIGDETRYTGGNIGDFITQKAKDAPGVLANMWNYIAARGDSVAFKDIGLPERLMRVLQTAGMSYKSLLSEAFAPLGYFTNFIELAIKLSTYESLANKPGVEFGQILTSASARRVSSFEELDSAMREAFVRPENAGTAEWWLGNSFQPFIRYAIQTPPMVMKMMIRRPSLFLAYARWRALNNEMEQERYDYRAAGFQDWELTDYPHALWADRKSGQIGLLMPNNFDPISNTWSGLTEAGKAVLRIGFGVPIGAPGQVRDMYDPTTNVLDDFSRQLIKNAYDWWQIPYELFSGKDAFTGKKLSENSMNERYSWNGLSLPGWAIVVASRVPFISELDRANPFGFAGVAPLTDANGNLILNENGEPVEPGRLSVFGAKRKEGQDKKKYDLRTQSIVYQALRLAGLNVRVVDYGRNLQQTYTDIDKTIKEISSQLNKSKQDIETDVRKGALTSGAETDRRVREQVKNAQTLAYLLIERRRVLWYMLQEKKFGGRVLPKEYLRESQGIVNQIEKTYGKAPMPLDEDLEKITKQIAEYLVDFDDAKPGTNSPSN